VKYALVDKLSHAATALVPGLARTLDTVTYAEYSFRIVATYRLEVGSSDNSVHDSTSEPFNERVKLNVGYTVEVGVTTPAVGVATSPTLATLAALFAQVPALRALKVKATEAAVEPAPLATGLYAIEALVATAELAPTARVT